ncbi:Rieske 2Fe-2S domain-containing protein [Scytonema tolypothrichoides VB-61278]|nr:Rieske 2Fe-2S domain-containing protein [Scytonema tolypothrichoides VB-61278]
MNQRHLYSTFPNSWFGVASSEDLLPRGVIPLHYFGKDFVLFRDEEGIPHILDAHCPHLGAHLGYGGRIEGETIRCPYHGWLWNVDGQCVKVPYASKLPSKVQIQSWPVREVNGLILMYYHAQGEPPHWEIPDLPESIWETWTPLRLVHRWKVRTNILHYLENSVDLAHLSNVHTQTFKAAKTDGVEMNGSIFINRMSQKYNLSSLAAGMFMSDPDGSVTTTYYGPGYDVSFYSIQTKMNLNLGLLTIFTGTPIDEEYLDIHIFFSVKKVLPQPFMQVLIAMARQDVARTFEQDIPILEHKVSLSHPLIYEGDGPLQQCWRWVSQFYSEQPALTNATVQQ